MYRLMPSDAFGFELRDHTADIALFVWGDRLEALFRAAADGLYAAIGEIHAHSPCARERLDIHAHDTESLLHDFLDELLFRFETRGQRLGDFTFDRLDDTLLMATAAVSVVDATTSILDREVKAVTYHDLNIVRTPGRYEVTIILDI